MGTNAVGTPPGNGNTFFNSVALGEIFVPAVANSAVRNYTAGIDIASVLEPATPLLLAGGLLLLIGMLFRRIRHC